MSANMISADKKRGLLAAIREQETNWEETFSGFITETLRAESALQCKGPVVLKYRGREYALEKPTLTASAGRGGDHKVRISLEWYIEAPLSKVVEESDITEELNTALCFGIQLLGNELSRKMVAALKSNPTKDPFMNMLFSFLKTGGYNADSAKISVIVPAYNVENTLERAVNSLRGQTHGSLEIIVVDDGSTDGTGAAADRLSAEDSRVKVIHTPNRGVTPARLAGISVSSGEWIGFMDGDDTVEPDMYEVLLKAALEHDADISVCRWKRVLPDGSTIDCFGTGAVREQDTIQGVWDLLCGTAGAILCNKLYRRSVVVPVADNPYMDTEINNHEDMLMNFLIFRDAEKSVYTDVCKYNWFVTPGSATDVRKYGTNYIKQLRVKQMIYELARGAEIEAAGTAFVNDCIIIYNLLLTKRFKAQLADVIPCIHGKEEYIPLLPKKRRVQLRLIQNAPWFYNPAYIVYDRIMLKLNRLKHRRQSG